MFQKVVPEGEARRKQERQIVLTEKSVSIGKPFTRSGTDQYDKPKCVFCQEENNEAVHEVRSANRDAKLKGAFKKAPTATAKIKIRSERARNAHAGDI